MSACKLHGQYSCDKCMLIAKQPTADLVARIAVDGALAVQMQDHIAQLKADLAAAQADRDNAQENFRFMTERCQQAQAIAVQAQAEAAALRALLLDCEMLETSDGVVHLRSDIKAALDAGRGGGNG